ncbi:hypothetical protein EBR43_04690 [bacterium]|nr:hypothetical protein [bacterium]
MAVKFKLQGEHLPFGELQSSETNNFSTRKVTHEFVAESLDEVLPAIRDFLKGLGYEPAGDLEFVDNFSSEEPFEYKNSWSEHNTKGNSE